MNDPTTTTTTETQIAPISTTTETAATQNLQINVIVAEAKTVDHNSTSTLNPDSLRIQIGQDDGEYSPKHVHFAPLALDTCPLTPPPSSPLSSAAASDAGDDVSSTNIDIHGNDSDHGVDGDGENKREKNRQFSNLYRVGCKNLQGSGGEHGEGGGEDHHHHDEEDEGSHDSVSSTRRLNRSKYSVASLYNFQEEELEEDTPSKISRFFRYILSTNLHHHTHGKPLSELHWFHKFQRLLADVLEGHQAQVIVIFLLLVDVLITGIEIIVEQHSSSGHYSHALHVFHKVLFYMTVSILSIFVIEITLKIVAFGWRFFTKLLFVFDLIVVVTSLVLEVIFGIRESVVVGMLLMLRLWRVIRVAYTLAYTAQLRSDELAAKSKERYEKRLAHKTQTITQLKTLVQEHYQHLEIVAGSLKELENSMDEDDPKDRVWKQRLACIHSKLM